RRWPSRAKRSAAAWRGGYRQRGEHARQSRRRRVDGDLATTHVLEKSDSIDQLHGEEPQGVGGMELVQRDEVRVTDVGQLAELLLEAIERRWALCLERLERDLLSAFSIERFVNDPHTAASQLTIDHEAVAERRFRLKTGHSPGPVSHIRWLGRFLHL